MDKWNFLLLLPYLLQISQCDGLCLVASVGPALTCVPSGAGHTGGSLSQSVEQRHLLCEAEGAEVRLLLTLTLTLTLALVVTLLCSLHCGNRHSALDLLGTLHLPGLPHLLPSGSALP